MKKVITLALCAAFAGSICAQKNVVKQAEKLAGKNDQIGDARGLIQQAMNNPETQNDPKTYMTAGKIEYDAFDNSYKKQMINPQDPSINTDEMGQQLQNGYNFYMKALALDSMPNEKGKTLQNHKGILSILNGHVNDFYNSGIAYYGNKKYYPEAYDAFMTYGDFITSPYASKEVKAIPDTVVGEAFYNAGISAWLGNNPEAGAVAFKKARLTNPDKKDSYIYEIACWQNIAGKDSLKVEQAQNEIINAAQAGYDKFGIEQPIFINNIINSLVSSNKIDQALEVLAKAIGENPNNAALYGLRGFVYDRAEKDAESEADYRKAASMPDVDFETLKNAAKKIYRVGAEKLNEINASNDPAAKQNLKTNYFDVAKQITDKAKTMKPDDTDLNYVIENIDYALETYFN